jgi:hypothetical protein
MKTMAMTTRVIIKINDDNGDDKKLTITTATTTTMVMTKAAPSNTKTLPTPV